MKRLMAGKRFYAAACMRLLLLLCFLQPAAALAVDLSALSVSITPNGTGCAIINNATMKTARLEFAVRGAQGAPVSVAVGTARGGRLSLTPAEDYELTAKGVALLFWKDDGMTAGQNSLADFVLAEGYGQFILSVVYPTELVQTTFYVYNQETIVFIVQPATTTIDENDDVLFSVRVTGTSDGRYAYQWQRRSRTGWKDVKGATTAAMMITTAEGYLTGYQYRCKVSSSAGEAYSHTACLRVNNVPATGDNGHPWLYVIGAMLSLCGVGGCVTIALRTPQEMMKPKRRMK